MYKPGGTIAEALSRIQNKTYVLPAIQREFVWKPEQIERLFDSLMQGYPFGTFLFWRVEPTTSGKFKFYDFVLNYHQRDAAHCPELGKLHHQSVTAVLDGQQRLTALNIGLRGSMAVKQPNKWWTNPDAFPKRTLRLDLLASQAPDEDGVVYRFRFLDDGQVARDENAHWFKVPDILGMDDGPAMLSALMARGLQGDALKGAYAIWGSGLDTLLTALREVVQQHGSDAFPVTQLRQVMTQRGKSLTFEPAEIDDLLHMEYGDKRLFPLLALLFPFVDLRNNFHIDHVFPISRFSRARLLKAGFGGDEADDLARHANQLPNLQLLDGAINNEKRAAMPGEWLVKQYPDPSSAQHYREKHLLGDVPDDLTGFAAFHVARRDRLRAVLSGMLGGPARASDPG